jgi:uncharacterized protein (TIGR03437 family)
MFRLFFVFLPAILASVSSIAQAAALNCIPSATPQQVRAEGIAERTGDIAFVCSGGAPNDVLTINLFFFLNVDITNRLTAPDANTFSGISLTADNGSGPQPISAPATSGGPQTLVFNGATFTLSPSGTVTLRISGVRGAANELDFDPSKSMQVLIGITPSQVLTVTASQLLVGRPAHGLYIGMASTLICSQRGSPLPQNPNSFASFAAAGSAVASTRVTEGFGDAFSESSAPQSAGADSGTRVILQYSGFPPGARLFVPVAVAGTDAELPTAGGDLGITESGGAYFTGSSTLLLSYVKFTNAKGAGGTLAYLPPPAGSGIVLLDGMIEVPLTDGSGIAVYEVVRSNLSRLESAQIPTFLSLAPFSGNAIQTLESVSLAPVSTVQTATDRDPIPRFQQITPPADCSFLGDCDADYFPALSVTESSLDYTAEAGGVTQTNYVHIHNTSGGVLAWTTSVQYADGSGWLLLSPTQGENNGTVRVDAVPGTLAPGTYHATLTVDAGPLAGSHDVAITFVVTAPAVQPPVIKSAVNGATFAAGPLAPGSIATLFGSQFSGTKVSATFDGLSSEVFFSNDTQINLLVPAGLGAAKTSAQVVVTVDGTASAPFQVSLAPFAPGIFSNGVLNQDYTLNDSAHPAAAASVIQIFATGLSGGVITAKIGSQVVDQPYYGGPAPGFDGLQQVDLILPADLTGSTVDVSVCGGPTTSQVVCSPPFSVAISQ